MAENTTGRRATGCLSREEATRRMHELRDMFHDLKLPRSVAVGKWGSGCAVYVYDTENPPGDLNAP